MVNNIGIWKYEKNTSDNRKCDMDRVADYIMEWIAETGYTIKTTIENIVEMSMEYFNSHCFNEDIDFYINDTVFNMEEYKNYIEGSGGIKEFDWTDGQEE